MSCFRELHFFPNQLKIQLLPKIKICIGNHGSPPFVGGTLCDKKHALFSNKMWKSVSFDDNLRPEALEIFTVSKVSGRKLSYANARMETLQGKGNARKKIFARAHRQKRWKSPRFRDAKFLREDNGEPQGNHKGATVASPKKNQWNNKESKIKVLHSSLKWKVSSWTTSFNNRFQDIQWIISKTLQWYLDICFQCFFREMLQNKDFYL